uniref:Uncharacterized protein n=1 Tax=Octopus bimaculoides TaxID=37653 RepID=A0A0L8I5B4_OCTBM
MEQVPVKNRSYAVATGRGVDSEALEVREVSSRKIEIATIEAIEDCLKEIKKFTTFIPRGRKYGSVDVRFATEDEAIQYSTVAIKMEEWVLLLTYCGKRVARREKKEQQIEQSEDQDRVDEVVQDDVEETAITEEEFTVVKKRKRKERVSSPPEKQKKKKVDEVEKEVEKEVENVVEKEVEKEPEEELEEEIEKEETVARVLAIPAEEEDLGSIERQQHESETARLTKVEEDKERERRCQDWNKEKKFSCRRTTGSRGENGAKMLKEFNRRIEKEGASLRLTPPENLTASITKRTVVYRKLSTKTKRKKRATVEAIEEYLKDVKSLTSFYTRGKRYGIVEEKEGKKTEEAQQERRKT